MKNTTLCYIEKNGMYLMMHRTKKQNDANKDKWIGIGGHMEEFESPLDCIMREVKEETGLTLTDCTYRGLISFCSPAYETEQMHLFTSHNFEGELKTDCSEGVLEWISSDDLMALPMWEGDRIFLSLLPQNIPFFLLKLVYDTEGSLRSHQLSFCGDDRKPLLISACLLGTACRYDGASKPISDTWIKYLSDKYILIPVCGEVLGGLPVPRLPAEIQKNGSVLRCDGCDVTSAYRYGAAQILRFADLSAAKTALLKARSPSCGKGTVYDGTFSGKLCDGNGITADLLIKNGITVYTEEELSCL